MKKVLSALLLAPCLLASSLAIAASGSTPQCTSGALNLVVVNSNLTSGNCTSAKGAGKYCVYELSVSETPFENDSCFDATVLFSGKNESISLEGVPDTAQMNFNVGTKGSENIKKLHFNYDHGSASDNCAEVFGSDAKCVITQSGDKDHLTYFLTISRN